MQYFCQFFTEFYFILFANLFLMSGQLLGCLFHVLLQATSFVSHQYISDYSTGRVPYSEAISLCHFAGPITSYYLVDGLF